MAREEREIRFEEIVNKDGFYITVSIPGILAATNTNYSVFWHVRSACEVAWVEESHTTIGSNAGAVTLNVERLDSGVALDSGDTILQTAFDLKSTIDTPVSKEGRTKLQNTILKPNQRLALKDGGTLTAVAGVCITIYLRTLSKGHYA